MRDNVERFPLHKARALPAATVTPRPAGVEAAASVYDTGPIGAEIGVSRAAPPSSHPSFLTVAQNCVDLARVAMSGEFVEDVSKLCKKCSDDLLFAAATEPHDNAMRDAMWILLINIKHYCEADSDRRPIWARAIANNKATLRDLYHLAVRP